MFEYILSPHSRVIWNSMRWGRHQRRRRWQNGSGLKPTHRYMWRSRINYSNVRHRRHNGHWGGRSVVCVRRNRNDNNNVARREPIAKSTSTQNGFNFMRAHTQCNSTSTSICPQTRNGTVWFSKLQCWCCWPTHVHIVRIRDSLVDEL